MIGKVKSLPEGKHFGFLDGQQNDQKKDIFFHRDDFQGHWIDLLYDFRNGKTIELEYDLERTPKGLKAKHVKRIDHPNEG